jgi:hypothetical protein
MSVRLVVLLFVACSSRPAPTSESKGRAAPVVAPIDAQIDARPIDAGCPVVTPIKIENGTCEKSSDCVLTDLAEQCDACNLDRVYPALKIAFDRRTARCTAPSCATRCPPVDTYTRGFYRPECRNRRCIAWRYHSGG